VLADRPANHHHHHLEKRGGGGRSARERFAAILAPLEAKAGKRLTGAGRVWCWRALTENEEGFARCAEDVLERARGNPVALLCRVVRDGDHRLTAPPPPAPPPPPCPECGVGRGHHTADCELAGDGAGPDRASDGIPY
jgi:hypothetical protein